jgi:hypothetical protein
MQLFRDGTIYFLPYAGTIFEQPGDMMEVVMMIQAARSK